MEHGKVDQCIGGQEKVRDDRGNDVQLSCKEKMNDQLFTCLNTGLYFLCPSNKLVWKNVDSNSITLKNIPSIIRTMFKAMFILIGDNYNDSRMVK